MLLDRRRAGVLLHPTSLPSRFGIGDLGPAAFAFLDYLARAKQSLWQVLPLGPTGFGDSPYASPSAFAGNPLLIAAQPLVDQGLLTPDDLADLASLPADHVDFGQLLPLKRRALQTAFQRGGCPPGQELDEFRAAQATWLDDFALFSALKDHHEGDWTEWPTELRDRQPEALSAARETLTEQIDLHVFCQFV